MSRLALTAIVLALGVAPGLAQPAPAASPAIPLIASEPGRLQRVDQGIVEVKVGAPFDISQHKALLTLVRVENADSASGFAEFRFRGNGMNVPLGNRFDVKLRFQLPSPDVCYFDVIGLKAPKGATPSAVLRVECE